VFDYHHYKKGSLRDAGDSTEALEVYTKDAGKSLFLSVPQFPQQQNVVLFSVPTVGEMGAAWILAFSCRGWVF